MSGRFACNVCGHFHEPHCISSPINVYPSVQGFVALPIDWERQRIKAAIAAMQGMLANPEEAGPMVAQGAVWHADKLIAELQKKEAQP